jgi:hypothetical protein
MYCYNIPETIWFVEKSQWEKSQEIRIKNQDLRKLELGNK